MQNGYCLAVWLDLETNSQWRNEGNPTTARAGFTLVQRITCQPLIHGVTGGSDALPQSFIGLHPQSRQLVQGDLEPHDPEH